MSRLKYLVLAPAMLAVMVLTPHVKAQSTNTVNGDIDGNLSKVGDATGLGNQPLEETIGLLINILLGILGIIFLILVIYAGFLWMTAGGDEKKVGTAKNILVTAVIGLIILLSAYAISTFVIDQLVDATGSDV